MRLNLNETVKVKLTKRGKKIYREHFSHLPDCFEKPEPRIDEDGFTEMQLWMFMEIFGEHMSVWKPNVIEPLEIVFDTEDSEACKEQKSKLESDLISRQAAIEAVTKYFIDEYDKMPYEYDEEVKDNVFTDMKWVDISLEHNKGIRKVLKSLPPVEPKPVMTEEVREALMRLTMCAREECSICKYENDCGYDKQVKMATENMNTILNVFLERPKVEWTPCTEPPKDRRNVFLACGTNDFKSCCIGHYEEGIGWYEDRNFFAKPIYDCKYWSDVPELPDMGDNQFDMRGDR